MNNFVSELKGKLDSIICDWGLSQREKDIVNLILRDVTSTKDIASELEISPITVRNHLEKIYRKSGCKNKNTLIVNILHHYLEENQNLSYFYRQPQVLIVDDEEFICDTLSQNLADLGIKVYTTTKPESVPDMLKKYSFDFIISDMKMPNLDGHELIKLVKNNHNYWPQVIVMTGHSEYLPEEIYNQGAISYINKPFRTEEIFEVILENYTDEKNFIRERFEKIKEEKSFQLPETISLDKTNIGTGGAFISCGEELLSKENMKIGNYIKFQYTISDLDSTPRETYAKILWKRNQDKENLKSGVGIKFIGTELVNTEKYHDYLRMNDIISFIPIGQAS